jgi:hypothetical protein
MDDINWGILAPIAVLELLLMIAALFMLVKAERTNGPKWLWALIIIFISMLGPVLFFVAGRKND